MAEGQGQHFMKQFGGPPNQFLVVVGDDGGKIRRHLNERLNRIEGEENSYFISTYYYSAKFGIRSLSKLEEVRTNFKNRESTLRGVFVAYKSLEHFKQAAKLAEELNIDTRVMIIDSLRVCRESDQVEAFAAGNKFEVVYLNPSDQQKDDAAAIREKLGMDRLLQTLDNCCWNYRVSNVQPRGSLTNVVGPSNGIVERFHAPEDIVSDDFGARLLQGYSEFLRTQANPAPQQAERVHLPPDSPTTTEETTATNPDDVSVSVDIDLVCKKDECDQKQQSEAKEEKAKSLTAKDEKKDA